MKSMEITAVGIDVSKRKSTVAVRRPGGVIVACPFDISHSSHDLEKLVSILKTTGGDILSAKGHLQAADVPCYILKITIYRSDDTMVDKFSQVAGNVPVTNNDPNRRYTVINGYPVVLNFAKEPNPGVFERVRDILLATSYTKKTS